MPAVVAETVIVFGAVLGIIVATFWGMLALEVKRAARHRRLLEEAAE